MNECDYLAIFLIFQPCGFGTDMVSLETWPLDTKSKGRLVGIPTIVQARGAEKLHGRQQEASLLHFFTRPNLGGWFAAIAAGETLEFRYILMRMKRSKRGCYHPKSKELPVPVLRASQSNG